MPYKPMLRRKFEKWLKQLGFTMKKTGFDWSVYDSNQRFICTIKIQHPGPEEVTAQSIIKFERKLKERGL